MAKLGRGPDDDVARARDAVGAPPPLPVWKAKVA